MIKKLSESSLEELKAAAKTNDFYASVLKFHEEKGGITPRQLKAIEQELDIETEEREAERLKVLKNPVKVDLHWRDSKKKFKL